MNKERKRRTYIILGVATLGIISILIGASFAFGVFQMDSTRRQVIKAADMDVILIEDSDGITLTDAVPVYDEVGLIGEAYKFRLVNQGGIPASYYIRLKDTTSSENKLSVSDVRLGIKINGVTEVRNLSDVSSLYKNALDSGIIHYQEEIHYELRLWIKDTVTDLTTIEGKTLSYKVEVELTDAKPTYLASSVKQGDYISYVGSNGCSGNACKGVTACGGSSSGWRVAYTEGTRVYLISAGNLECINRAKDDSVAGGNNFMTLLNNYAKKYCNPNFVDGTCQDNANSWAIAQNDFQKIIKQKTGSDGDTLKNCNLKKTAKCGYQNNLIDIGASYWFRGTFDAYQSKYPWYWDSSTPSVSYSSSGNYGFRPVIQLSTTVFAKRGMGTQQNPYIIEKE